jgi:hypothetical protein
MREHFAERERMLLLILSTMTAFAAPEMIDWKTVDKRVTAGCASCHGQHYSIYDNAKKRAKSIKSSIANDFMPPDEPLDKCAKAVFTAWIKDKFPRTSTIPISTLPACK